jgi:hypothetical protein
LLKEVDQGLAMLVVMLGRFMATPISIMNTRESSTDDDGAFDLGIVKRENTNYCRLPIVDSSSPRSWKVSLATALRTWC